MPASFSSTRRRASSSAAAISARLSSGLRGELLGDLAAAPALRESTPGSSFAEGAGGGEDWRLGCALGAGDDGGLASTEAAACARKPEGLATRSTITVFQTCSSGT